MAAGRRAVRTHACWEFTGALGWPGAERSDHNLDLRGPGGQLRALPVALK